jgi:exosortase family protein XrtF
MSLKGQIVSFFHSKTSRFFLYSALVYLFWFLLYEFYIKPKTLLDETIISNIIFTTKRFLELFSYKVYYTMEDLNYQMIGVDGAHPIWIGGPCDGVAIMAIFLIFVSAYPGNQIHKLWFVPLGILAIHFINILRVAGLTLINFYAPEYLDFNHNYTFTLLVYGFIFILWITWVNKFSKR